MDTITAHFWWKKKTKWENLHIPKNNMRFCGRWTPKEHKTPSKSLGCEIMSFYDSKRSSTKFCINSMGAFCQLMEALKIKQGRGGLVSKRKTLSLSSGWRWAIRATFSNIEVAEGSRERPGCLWIAVLPQMAKCKKRWHFWSKEPLVLSMSARHGPCCLSPLPKCASHIDLNLISNRWRNRGLD